MKFKNLFLIIALSTSFLACQEDFSTDIHPAEDISVFDDEYKYITGGDSTFYANQLKVGVPVNYSLSTVPYYNDFDIENATPLTVKYKGYTTTIYFPFEIGTVSTYMDYNTRQDIKRVDGWDLVYNWFPTNGEQIEFPAILIYNKFRGQMKLFYYHMNDNLTTGGNVIAAIGTIGKNSKLFNYSQTVTSANNTLAFSATTQSTLDNIDSQFIGLSANTWYAFEWDLSCYDPNVNYHDQIALLCAGVKIENINLHGAITGGINGKLQTTSTNTPHNSAVKTSDIKDAIKGGSSKIVKGFYKDQISPKFTELQESSSSSFFKKLFGKLATDSFSSKIGTLVAGPFAGFVASPLSKFIGKIFPGKTTQQTETTIVNLDVKLDANLTGTIQGSASAFSYHVVLPKLVDHETGVTYNNYGVFSLKSNPKIGIRWDYVYISDEWGDYEMLKNPNNYAYAEIFDFKNKLSDLIVFNPALLSEATVSYDWQIVTYGATSEFSNELYNYSPGLQGVVLNNGTTNSYSAILATYSSKPEVYPREYSDSKFYYRISNRHIGPTQSPINYTSNPNVTRFKHNPSSPGGFLNGTVYKTNTKIMVTVKVTPKNGSSPIIINQMFEPEIILEQLYFPGVIMVSTSGI